MDFKHSLAIVHKTNINKMMTNCVLEDFKKVCSYGSICWITPCAPTQDTWSLSQGSQGCTRAGSHWMGHQPGHTHWLFSIACNLSLYWGRKTVYLSQEAHRAEVEIEPQALWCQANIFKPLPHYTPLYTETSLHHMDTSASGTKA